MTKALPGKKSVLVQIRDDANAKLFSTKYQADIKLKPPSLLLTSMQTLRFLLPRFIQKTLTKK
jgi:hypothetical protein